MSDKDSALKFVQMHKDLMKHYPWVSMAVDEKPKAQLKTDDLERMLRAILDSGDWGERVKTFREVLRGIGVDCE